MGGVKKICASVAAGDSSLQLKKQPSPLKGLILTEANLVSRAQATGQAPLVGFPSQPIAWGLNPKRIVGGNLLKVFATRSHLLLRIEIVSLDLENSLIMILYISDISSKITQQPVITEVHIP